MSITKSVHPAIEADAAADTRLGWWLVVGNQFGWGRSPKSEASAIRYMKNNSRHGYEVTKYTVYRCTENTTLNEMGWLTRPAEEPAPVLIRSYEKTK
jgi:hypothetical protein